MSKECISQSQEEQQVVDNELRVQVQTLDSLPGLGHRHYLQKLGR